MEERSGASAQRIDLGEVVDITTVKTLWQQFKAALESKQPLTLVGGAVTQMDTAGAQLISAFMQDAQAESLAVDWQDVSAAVRNTAQMLGLSERLALP